MQKETTDMIIGGISLIEEDIILLNYEITGLADRKDGGGLNASGIEGTIALNNPVYKSATGKITLLIQGESVAEVNNIWRKFKTKLRQVSNFEKVQFSDDLDYFRYGLIQSSPAQLNTQSTTDGLVIAEFDCDMLFKDAYEYANELVSGRNDIARLYSVRALPLQIYNPGVAVGAKISFGHLGTGTQVPKTNIYSVTVHEGKTQVALQGTQLYWLNIYDSTGAVVSSNTDMTVNTELMQVTAKNRVTNVESNLLPYMSGGLPIIPHGWSSIFINYSSSTETLPGYISVEFNTKYN